MNHFIDVGQLIDIIFSSIAINSALKYTPMPHNVMYTCYHSSLCFSIHHTFHLKMVPDATYPYLLHWLHQEMSTALQLTNFWYNSLYACHSLKHEQFTQVHAAAATPLPAVPGDPDDGPGGAEDAGSGVFIPGDPVNVGECVCGASENENM